MNRKLSIRFFLPVLFMFCFGVSYAQLGKIDSLYYGNMGLGGTCLGGLVQPDSSVIICGSFTNCNERVVNYIAKINPDGTNNYSFNTGTGANNNVNAVARQADGKLILAGSFTSFNGTTFRGVIRLNTNGSIDTTFHVGIGFAPGVPLYAICIQASGDIILAGAFAGYNGASVGGIVRLLPNGTRDTSFHMGTGANSTIYTMTAQNNGQILIGGVFTKYNGVTDSGVARLNSDGSLDTTFSLQRGPGLGKVIYTLCPTSGGKILVGGTFTSWAGRTENYMARLNSNGSLDTTFSIGTGFNSYVYTIVQESNNQLMIGGYFNTYKGNATGYIIRTDTSGNVDGTFNPGYGTNGQINTIFLNSTGSIYAGGTFSIEDSFARHNLVRLQSNGTIDQTFFYNSKLNADVKAIVTQSTGKVILAGSFTKYNDIAVGHILRLNTDGSLDTSFHVGTGANGNLYALALTSSGQILVGGQFTQFNGQAANSILRLNSDGSKDNTFTPSTFYAAPAGTIPWVTCFSLDNYGRIYAGGVFYTVGGVLHGGLAKLSANGIIDNTFTPQFNGPGGIYSIALQPGGKVIAAGGINKCDNVTISGFCRVDSLGNIDTATFRIGLGQTGGTATSINSVSLQPDGKILIGSPFMTSFNGTVRDYAARLNSNGSIDSSFVANITGYGNVGSIVYYNSGAIIGGNYYGINSISELDIDLVDTSGNPNTSGFAYYNNSPVNYLYLDTINERILAGGTGTTSNGQVSSFFQALIGAPKASVGIDSVSIVTPVCASGTTKVHFKNEKSFNAGNVFTVQLSNSSGSFASPVNIGTQTAGSTGWDSATVTIPGGTASGSNYQVRLVSTNPIYTSASSAGFAIGPWLDTLTAGGPTTFCQGGNVILTSKAAGTYNWSSGGSTQSFTATSSGTYTVTATTNNCSATASMAVTVNTNPTATATNTGPYCSYGTIVLTGGAGGLTSYVWSGPNAFTSVTQSPTLLANGNGGSYTITVTNANGCSATATTLVIVNAVPAATASNTGPYCSYGTIALTGGPNSMSSYNWSGPNAFTSAMQSPTLAANGNGGSYTLTVTDGNGCTASVATSIIVNTPTMATAGNTGPYCSYATIALNAGYDSVALYTWSGPNSFTSFSQDTSLPATGNGGLYTVTITDINGCTASAATTVIVNTAPVATASNTGAYNYYDTIALSAGPDSLAAYNWNGPNSFSSGVQNVTRLAAGNGGLYSVTVSDANGCTASASTTAIVIEDSLTISVGSITGSPFCAGSSISIPFSLKGTFDSANVFTAQLSDSSGNFFYPLIMGVDSGSTSGIIIGILPFNITGGTQYQIMISASDTSYADYPYSGISLPFTINSIGTPNNIGSYSVCSDTAYTFTFDSITAGNGGNKVQWSADSSFSSFSFIGADANVSITVAAGADSVIWVRSTDSTSGCYSLPEKVIMQVNRNPVDTAANTGPYCYEGTIALTATPAGLAGYVWSGPDTAFSAFAASTTLAAAGNAGTYTVTVTDLNGCTATAATTVLVNEPMAPPTIPVSQSTCSDTALSFTFTDTLGSSGNQLEWAGNSMFLNSQISGSPLTIPLTIGAGGNMTVYIRSSDSTSGCTSVPVTATATVYALPFPLTPTVSLDTICPGSSTSIIIPNAENGKNYVLQVGSSTIATGSGNGFSLSLSTGAVDSNTTFTVTAIDTLSGCYRQLQPAITVYVDSVISAPAFTAGDTILYTNESIQYTAANLSGSTISYFIDSGYANIDSVSGWVSNVASSFTVEAVTAPMPGCIVAAAYMPVTYSPTPQPPAIPASQTAWSDTAVTFVIPDVEPGRGATEVEWSLDSTFATSTTITDSGSITLTVDTSSTDTVYMRSVELIETRGDGSIRIIKGVPVLFTGRVIRKPLAPNGNTPVTYVNLFTSSTISDPINTSNPVGVTPGSAGTSPSGAATYNIPIACPPGTNGMAPQIALTYNSQRGNGPMGYGWGISGLSSISRSGLDNFHDQQVGPITLTNSDPFNIDGTRLTPLSGANGANGTRYGKEAEDYSVIYSYGKYGSGTSPEEFIVITKRGITMEYGNTPDSRLLSADGQNILQWRLNKVTDAFGNYMIYKYDNTNGCRITEIDYTGNTSQSLAPYTAMLFNYEKRFDVNTVYTAGTPVINQQLLTSIDITSAGSANNFKDYVLAYGKDDLNSYLTSITEYGTDGTHLNATKFQYGVSPNLEDPIGALDNFNPMWDWSQPNQIPKIEDPASDLIFDPISFNQAKISGDFNGDGYSDNLVLYQALPIQSAMVGNYTPDNIAFMITIMNPSTAKFEKKYENNKAFKTDPTFQPCVGNNSTDRSTTLGGTTNYADGGSVHENYDYFVGDYTGIGRDGVLEIQRSCNEDALEIGDIYYYTFDNSGNPLPKVQFPTPANAITQALAGYVSAGDFDGDGIMDYILFLKDGNALISFPGKNLFNQPLIIPAAIDASFSLDTYNWYFLTAPTPYSENYTGGLKFQSYVIDFDGDSKMDLLYVTPTNSYVYLFSNADGVNRFTLAYTLNYPTLNANDQIYLGDFNGDGKTDILTHQKNGVSISTNIIIPSNYRRNPGGNQALVPTSNTNQTDDVWDVGYSTGKTYIEQAFLENKYEQFATGGGGKMVSSDGETRLFYSSSAYQTALASSQELIIGDFNGDGKSDVFFSATPLQSSTISGISNYSYSQCTFNQKMYYSQGNSFHTVLLSSMLSGPAGFAELGDFNGDGRTDLGFSASSSIPDVCYSVAGDNDFIETFFNPYGQQGLLGEERLLQQISDGFNRVESFNYMPLTDPDVHIRGTYINYPLMSSQMPMYVVKSLAEPDGIGGININTFKYYNALTAYNGIGFVGFESTSSYTSASNTTTTTQSYNYMGPYYRPQFVTQSTSVGGQLISTAGTQFAQARLGINHYFFYKELDDQINNLAGTTSYSEYGYDNYGNANSVTSNNGVETSTSTTSYGHYGSYPYPSEPTQTILQTTRAYSGSFELTTNYHYYNNGALSAQVPALSCAATTRYNYDGYGNLITKTVGQLLGFDQRTESYIYDNNGRFLVSSKNILGQTATVSNDINWGKALSYIGVDGNEVRFSYDGYGRTSSVIPPRGITNIVPIAYNWAVDDGLHSIFTVTATPTGSPEIQVWKDAFGREVQKQTMGFGGNWLTSSAQYTNLNKPHHVIKLHYASEPIPDYYYSYDALNRTTDIEDPLGNHTNINYSYANGNLITTTTLEPSGRSTSQTTDASGKVISATDAGGTLYYTYDSRGNRVAVKNSAGYFILNYIYDACNNMTTQVEPNCGTYTYVPDIFGQVTSQSDQDGNTYTMQYNTAGQMTQRAGPEGTATYNYVPAGNGGANQLSGISCTGSLTSQSFSYDVYGNQKTVSEIINGHTYTTIYNYDNYDNITSVVYPGNTSTLQIDYSYDGNGYLIGIKDDAKGIPLYTPLAMNSYGQATSYTLGNNKTSALTTNYGIPVNYYTAGIQDLTLNVDLNGGSGGGGTLDLLNRTDGITGNSETFTYDASDRLKSAKVNSNGAMLFDFADNGNINSKTDVGDYSYGTINAVASVTNDLGNISNNTQNIKYVGFNKASVISENDDTLSYAYGPDFNRRFSQLDSAGILINTRIYCGNYEINDDQSGNPQQIYYINSPNGLVAMIVTDNNGTTDYSVYTDQLGSILTVTADDPSATIVAQQNFDAWGRNRNPADWSYTEPITPNFASYNYRCPSVVPNWLYRGYTGHEMLPEFGLINMNGRMYDPLLGRMLSPDNNVADPLSTQAYNRYSYCSNNPLKYTDPSGWDATNGWSNSNWSSPWNVTYMGGADFADNPFGGSPSGSSSSGSSSSGSSSVSSSVSSSGSSGYLWTWQGAGTGGDSYFQSPDNIRDAMYMSTEVCNDAGNNFLVEAWSVPVYGLEFIKGLDGSISTINVPIDSKVEYSYTAVPTNNDYPNLPPDVEPLKLPPPSNVNNDEPPMPEVGSDAYYKEMAQERAMNNAIISNLLLIAVTDGVGELNLLREAEQTVEYEELVNAAREKYPNKAFKIEYHHIEPKYMGGAENGETVPIDAAYHQVITNEFRAQYPYGQGPITNKELRQEIMDYVYGKYPLPK